MSIHKTSSDSALKLQMSSIEPADKSSIPSTPVKEKPRSAIVDPAFLSVGYKSQVSPFNSVASYRSHGSKEEAFYDTQAWLDSDCDDDFYSVNGDFTPSRGNTPVHNGVGNSRFNRTFSPHVNRALFDGRPPLRSASNLSRGSTPVHHRSNSAASPRVSITLPAAAPGSSQDPSSIPKKKKKLADLFRESIRERAGESLALDTYENASTPNSTATPYASGNNSVSSSGKWTPTHNYVADKEKPPKVAQCCFPRLVPSRSLRENKKVSSTSMTRDGLKP